MAGGALTQFMKRIVEDRRKTREAMGKLGDEVVTSAIKNQYSEQEAQQKMQNDYAMEQVKHKNQMDLERYKQKNQTSRLFQTLRSKEKVAAGRVKKELSSGYFQFSESLRSMLDEGGDSSGVYDVTAYPTLMKSFGNVTDMTHDDLVEALGRYQKTLKGPDLDDFNESFSQMLPEIGTTGASGTTGKPNKPAPSEEAIAFTMKKYKMTRQQVLDRLNGK